MRRCCCSCGPLAPPPLECVIDGYPLGICTGRCCWIAASTGWTLMISIAPDNSSCVPPHPPMHNVFPPYPTPSIPPSDSRYIIVRVALCITTFNYGHIALTSSFPPSTYASIYLTLMHSFFSFSNSLFLFCVFSPRRCISFSDCTLGMGRFAT